MERRTFLKFLPSAAVAGTSSVGTAAAHETSPHERMRHHLAEFKRAAQEADPRIYSWAHDCLEGADPTSTTALSLKAYRRLGQYEGDGEYMVVSRGAVLPAHVAYVPRFSIDGKRMFAVRPVQQDSGAPTEYLSETRLEEIVLSKLPAL